MRAQRPGESALLLLDAIDTMAELGVPYAVVGAMAASVHGVVRASLDADAVLAIPVDELHSLERVLRGRGLTAELRLGDSDDPIGAVLSVTDRHDNRVDLLVGLRGLDPAAFSRTVEVPFHGTPLRVIGLEDFIAMKLFAHGPQDIEDARAALSATGGAIDLGLLKILATRFGRDTGEALERLLRAVPNG
jgi:hypothetical protein